MSEKSVYAIKHEYIGALRSAASFSEDTHRAAELLFQQRKATAENILEYGENENNTAMFMYLNSKLREYYGII